MAWIGDGGLRCNALVRGIHESVRETSLCDIAVMLHLRACYVSKAAILTMPMQSVSVRKSKSRLNSKGLDR